MQSPELLVMLGAAVMALVYTVRRLTDAWTKRNPTNGKVQEFDTAIADLQE